MLHSDICHAYIQWCRWASPEAPTSKAFCRDSAVQSCQHPAVETQDLAAVRLRKGVGGSQQSKGSHLGRCCLQEERDVLQQLQLLKLLPIKSQWWRMTRRESFFYNFCRNEFSTVFPREPGTFKGMFSPYFEWVLRLQEWRTAKVDLTSVLSNGCMRLICVMQQKLTFNTATLAKFFNCLL